MIVRWEGYPTFMMCLMPLNARHNVSMEDLNKCAKDFNKSIKNKDNDDTKNAEFVD
jgi:hypothetical protein